MVPSHSVRVWQLLIKLIMELPFDLVISSTCRHHARMIIFGLLLFLFLLVIWGSLLVFSVAAGVAALPRRIVLWGGGETT